MFNIRFIFADGSFNDFSNITKIEFYSADKKIVLEGDGILNHHFSDAKTYCLYSADSSYTVIKGQIKRASVTKAT